MLRTANAMQLAVVPALRLLPPRLDSKEARVLLLAIGLQESGLTERRQRGNGPARGLWQFERGGGALGICQHRASMELTRLLCRDRDVGFEPRSVWAAMEHDDVFAAGCARLLLLTDPRPLPALGDAAGAYAYYLRNWRPGRPHEQDWPGNYQLAMEEVVGA